MRNLSVVTLGFVLAVSACAGRSTSAMHQAAPTATVPPGTLVLINGAPLASGHTLAELTRSSIITVEVLKGAAARVYGATAERGVILIATRDSATAARMTGR